MRNKLWNATILSVVICCLFVVPGCQQSANQSKKIVELQTELESFQKQLKELKQEFPAKTDSANEAPSQSPGSSKQLVHIVWFKLKEDADVEQLIGEIRKLSAINEVHHLQIGKFQDLGDQRAMSELDLIMQMSFDSESDYQTYQAHEIHQQLKSDVGQFISAPPVTYDYWTE